MELAVVRREAAGTGTNTYNESETLVKYEVMDGAPVKGEGWILVILTLSRSVADVVDAAGSTHSDTNIYNESEVVIKYEVMDVSPVKGRSWAYGQLSI